MTPDDDRDLTAWEQQRPALLGLAYRMLGDVGRAEDMVQEAWLRWRGRAGDEVAEPRAYLFTVVTRLCLNELTSARARREETRGERLPEPVASDGGAAGGLEALERVSMALLAVLQRLTPGERAVLLLHEVFDFGHAEIAALVGKSPAACRKLLERARVNVAAERRLIAATREEHARLLAAFMQATMQGDVAALLALLADDAVLVADAGTIDQIEGVRALRAPLAGPARIAAFVTTVAGRTAGILTSEVRELNGQPAMVLRRAGAPFGAMMLGVADGRIHRVYFQADGERLGRIGAPPRGDGDPGDL
jgi:RNA polymerase sigma-70 factor, ECF subfamily